MKQNIKQNSSWNAFRYLSDVSILFLAVFLMAGCSGPSEITVTGIRSVQSEVQDTDVSENQDSPVRASNTAAESIPSPSEQIAVYVCGAVQKPGVCYLPPGARVCDAVDAAGGFSASADSEWLNQAKMLADGEMLIVYTMDETRQMKEQGIARGGVMPADNPAAGNNQAAMSGLGSSPDSGTGVPDASNNGSSLVNLNTASKEELMSLPGIGEAKADAIIRYRTESGFFASTEDVMNISGIKNSIYDKIKDKVTV